VVFPEGFPLSQILPIEFIMLPNEKFALECRAYYDEIGLVVDERNGEFAHCPFPEGMGEEGYYLLHEHHQQQGILQSRDVGRRCFWVGYAKNWLIHCDPIPETYFDLWDIYEEFITGKHAGQYGKSGFWLGKTGEQHPAYGRRGELHPQYGKKNPELSERNKLRTGELHPGWGKAGAMRGVKGADHPQSKKIEVTFPDGSTKLFASIREASIFLNGNESHISGWTRKNHTPRRGKFKDHTFRTIKQ